ncbi:MAG: 50S ribosome-binding GTPase [Anaerolineae bacterium]|nr:50S ribosome-binding GTPase [Anaerolineae bacterium]
MNWLLLPNQLEDIQFVLRSLDWQTLKRDVERESHSRLVIVGPVNSGKSTLFNRLHGQNLSAVSAVPGTTQGIVEHPIGPFLLVDTPGFGEVWGVDRATTARTALCSADLVLLLLDAAAGVRQSDHDLYLSLLNQHQPVVVALNKADLVKQDLPWILENAESLLGFRPIPISARAGTGITDRLLPALLETQPGIAVAMARSLPLVRAELVKRIIRRTAWVNALIALEPVPGLDIPLLLAAQTRMILRIASAYGESMDVSHARELLTTLGGSLLSRYLGAQLAKFVPVLGWLVSAIVSGASTWAMGEATRRYIEADRQISIPDLKSLYQSLRKIAPRRLFRRRSKVLSISSEDISASEPGNVV